MLRADLELNLGQTGHVICNECCTVNEVERSMLVTAQTHRLVVRKDAPLADKLKDATTLLRTIVEGGFCASSLKQTYCLGIPERVLPGSA